MSDEKGARVLLFRPRDGDEKPLRGGRVPRFDPEAAVEAPAAAVSQEKMPAEEMRSADLPSDAGSSTAPPTSRSGDDAPPRRRRQDATPLRRSGEVTPFRRHKGERLRYSRRPPLLRFAKPFLLAVAIVGGPMALAVWIYRSPVFAMTELEITSVDGGRVSEAWVREALEPALGWNLPRLPLPWVDAALKRHPWVEATALRKELPNRLDVRVIERREVALRRHPDAGGEAAFFYVDARGEDIAPYDPTDGETDLPLIMAASGVVGLRPALSLFEEIEAVAPGWAAGLSEVEVLGEQEFRVWSAELTFPLLVRSGTLARKTPYLEELLPEIAHRYAEIEAVDLRFARRIIVQPTVRKSGRRVPGGSQKGLGG